MILWSGRTPGEGNGHPLHYSCLENSMDRGAQLATVHGVAIAHLLDDVARVVDAGILLATAHKEHVELLVECFGIGEHARHLGL